MRKKIGRIITPLIILLTAIIILSNINKNNDVPEPVIRIPKPVNTPTETPEPVEKTEPHKQKSNPNFENLVDTYDNDDIIAYLTIDDTSINYPVLQTDDNEFYLHHNISKQPDAAGSIFMDYENNLENNDKNTIIYGHNMKQQIMFHDLRKYEQYNFYENHRFIRLETPTESRLYEIFACYVAPTDFMYILVDFPYPEFFQEMLDKMLELSLYETGVLVTPNDYILSLSTCTNEPDDTRLVISAKLIQE